MKLRSYWLSILLFTLTCAIAGESPAPARDGSHDFDFLIGNWKAHVRRLPDRLVGSNNWIEYNGISNHKKLLDSNANFEEFNISPKSARMEQSFSADGGKTWETNWICELSR
jgi:hypothetical protein